VPAFLNQSICASLVRLSFPSFAQSFQSKMPRRLEINSGSTITHFLQNSSLAGMKYPKVNHLLSIHNRTHPLRPGATWVSPPSNPSFSFRSPAMKMHRCEWAVLLICGDLPTPRHDHSPELAKLTISFDFWLMPISQTTHNRWSSSRNINPPGHMQKAKYSLAALPL